MGSNLVVALKERHSLYGLDIVAPEKEGVVKTFFWKDIEPASFPMRNLPEFDAIIHLAGKAHDTKNRSAAQSYFDINTGLTQKIFDFFLESSAKKFVFFSSVKAAADSVDVYKRQGYWYSNIYQLYVAYPLKRMGYDESKDIRKEYLYNGKRQHLSLIHILGMFNI